jgi:diguanylate cyclase (GGDEF)-like protein
MSRRGWLPLWPLVLMVAHMAVLTVLAGSAGYDPVKWLSAMAVDVLGLAVTVRAAFQRRVPARERRPWMFFVGYWVLHLVTAAAFAMAFEGGSGAPPKPTFLLIGSVAWVLNGVPTLMCLFSFPMRPMTRPERIRLWLDIATVCGGGFIPLWFLVLVPAIEGTTDSTTMITIAQPVEHLVLLFAVCAVMMRGSLTSLRHPLTFLFAGQLAIGAGVLTLGYMLTRLAELTLLLPFDLAMLGGHYLLIVAATVQIRRAGRDERRTTTGFGRRRRPTALPYIALGLGYSVLVAAAAESGSISWIGLIAATLIMTGAVAGRQVIALRENHHFVVRDVLTGLSSRFGLYDNLDRAIERSARTGRPTAVLLIDLNAFKPINDRLGHAAGDDVLVGFAQALQMCVRSGDTAGRLGGDEFVVILPDVTDAAAAQKVADAIVAECATPFAAAGEQVMVGASIGISITDSGQAWTSQELLRRADVAMYQIKHQRSRSHVLFYDLSMDLDPQSMPEPVPMPGLTSSELAELDRLRSQVAELERKGTTQPVGRLR